jgi:general secretion pathway protein F
MNNAQAITTDTTSTTLWRYVAVDGGRAERRGELAGGSAADVRASLRRIGLQVIDVRPLRSRKTRFKQHADEPRFMAGVGADLKGWWHARLRASRSRGSLRAEIYDSLATMMSSGLPLLDAVHTLVESRVEGRSRVSGSGVRSMLVEMREQLRGGDSLAQSMQTHPSWFDPIDIAMVEAGQHGGSLPVVLSGLAERHERSSDLAHRMWGALAYPLLVMLVGLGVVVFLSVKTLPDLTRILIDANIAIPTLTSQVMWFGQALAANWLWLVALVLASAIGSIVVPRIFGRLSVPILPRRMSIHVRPPRILRQVHVGGLVIGLADLLRSGVPVVEALRVLAPAQRSRQLRTHLVEAAQRIERGDELSEALGGNSQWFDAELRRLLDIGQASGELDIMLTRIGERYQRRARRLIDRLTTLLEPAVLLLLALLVGIVVMAAILPLLSLQEII